MFRTIKKWKNNLYDYLLSSYVAERHVDTKKDARVHIYPMLNFYVETKNKVILIILWAFFILVFASALLFLIAAIM